MRIRIIHRKTDIGPLRGTHNTFSTVAGNKVRNRIHSETSAPAALPARRASRIPCALDAGRAVFLLSAIMPAPDYSGSCAGKRQYNI